MIQLFSLMTLGAGRPSISGLGDWVSNEVGTGIGIVVLIIGIIHWASGKYGRMIALFIVGGLLFLVSKGPETVFNALAGIWQMIFGG
ncbi:MULTISPECIES: TcpD family membrane protein [Staphylococcus]|uniref:Conjugal transfer protein n=1 Tax=Staphylococcus agnetis TaxID=985762 RepID=A0ABX3Z6G9_9STAP|nr:MULTISPECIES: TcpD family membrane protein [Staphylococcus]ALN77505.1 hypothetical protein EP23_09150 [Staphylococcus agnetis]MDG4943465.1 TcpD family membrane protein [Staphylococcus agnetis]OSP13790.1 hypothetical protein B9L42_12250 [Staphylococcus agnetis]OSP23017.1 hypothetical protein B9M87_09780 [Staphylococcus agnetis]OTW31551.1 hypothetical protein B9M88_04160 [Staphylococcus agnetis]